VDKIEVVLIKSPGLQSYLPLTEIINPIINNMGLNESDRTLFNCFSFRASLLAKLINVGVLPLGISGSGERSCHAL
jgi:hypothetical protein